MDVTDATFATEVLQASETVPVLVDFWAPWCGPCRVLGPVLERMAQDAKGRYKLVKINTEDSPRLAQKFGVSSIPEVKLFKGGKVVAAFTGALPKDRIAKFLDTHIPTATRLTYEAALAV